METSTPSKPKNSLWNALGPGLVTGVSDDDPSGIATYSQAGAAFGYGLLWTLLFTYPLMGGIQEISARIGRVTGRGLAGNIRRLYPPWLLYGLVGLMLVANIVNIGADLAAMGEATALLIGGPVKLYVGGFALLSAGLIIFTSYKRYSSILKWLALVLLAYVATAWVAHVDWGQAIRHTLLPSFDFSTRSINMIVAVLGTTISPYLFFWQASGEVEEIEATPQDKPLKQAPQQAPEQIWRIKADTYLGMGISNLVAFFIMLVTGATLHATGKTNIDSAAQAAAALEPMAGPAARWLFSLGIIGTGLMAVPVLAGAAAYGLGEALRWRTGLGHKPSEAKGFYVVIAVSTLLGLGINFTPIKPIDALVLSAIINGLIAGPVMVVVMLLASNPRAMGEFTLSRRLKVTGWIATALMLLSAVALVLTLGKQ